MKYGHLELHIEELLKEKGISKNTICKELIQRPVNQKLPNLPTHKLTIAFISTTEYRTVT